MNDRKFTPKEHELAHEFSLAHEALELIFEGAIRIDPSTQDDVLALLKRFSDEAHPILGQQMKTDLLNVPPDDRDDRWRELMAEAERED